MIKLWLDDLRDPENFGLELKDPIAGKRALHVLGRCGRAGWIWVKTIDDAKKILLENKVDVLSCDNDLGYNVDEGYKLLDWLEEMSATSYYQMTDDNSLEVNEVIHIPEFIFVHSDDMARVKSMQQTISSIERFKKRE